MTGKDIVHIIVGYLISVLIAQFGLYAEGYGENHYS